MIKKIKRYFSNMVFNLGYVLYFLKKALKSSKQASDVEINSYDPKKKFRWILIIPGLHSFVLKSCTRPIVYKSSWKYKELNTAGSLQIETYDPIAPSAAQQFWTLLKNEKCFDFTLQLLDGLGNEVERWEFKQGDLTQVNFGDLDYSKRESVVIQANIQYQSVELIF